MACHHGEPFSDQIKFLCGIPVYSSSGYIDNIIPSDSISVTFYNSFKDYTLNNNPIIEVNSDNEGKFELPRSLFNDSLYIDANQYGLNNLRFFNPKSIYQLKSETSINGTIRYHNIYLSSTPTKLQIKIQSNFQPVHHSIVQLYLTESDYLNKIRPQENFQVLELTYGDLENIPVSKREIFLTPFFRQISDKSGIVEFKNLEPRKYWIEVTGPDGKTNKGTVFHTNEPLSNNSHLINQMSIEIY